jgi:hypothetical protein
LSIVAGVKIMSVREYFVCRSNLSEKICPNEQIVAFLHIAFPFWIAFPAYFPCRDFLITPFKNPPERLSDMSVFFIYLS